jgi:hypothetical protein
VFLVLVAATLWAMQAPESGPATSSPTEVAEELVTVWQGAALQLLPAEPPAAGVRRARLASQLRGWSSPEIATGGPASRGRYAQCRRHAREPDARTVVLEWWPSSVIGTHEADRRLLGEEDAQWDKWYDRWETVRN